MPSKFPAQRVAAQAVGREFVRADNNKAKDRVSKSHKPKSKPRKQGTSP